MYTIKLADGTKLKNLDKNGDNFISDSVIEDSVFEGNLETVEISDGKTTETFKDMTRIAVGNPTDDGKFWFALVEKSAQDKAEEAIENSITDIQVALADVYEMIAGGME